ncbi:hypothetical protein AMK27_02500 [Streptomyces sp. CB02009]|nr:hypothetical protein AMK27_02500 [Streptomyces sp. CB02009]
MPIRRSCVTGSVMPVFLGRLPFQVASGQFRAGFRLAGSRCHGEVVHVGDGLGGVVEAVAALSAVAEE